MNTIEQERAALTPEQITKFIEHRKVWGRSAPVIEFDDLMQILELARAQLAQQQEPVTPEVGKVYQHRGYGPVTFDRIDHYMGETTYQIQTSRGTRYEKPEHWQAAIAPPATAQPAQVSDDIALDAARYRWLREQHETDIETLTQERFCVFMPGKELHLEPVSCWPGELDAAIDKARALLAEVGK